MESVKQKGRITLHIGTSEIVKYRGGHYGDFGVSRSTVEFLNNILSVLEVFLFVKRKFSY